MRRLLLLALLIPAALGFAQTLVVTVKNPAKFNRSHETIAIPLSGVTEALGQIDPSRLRVTREGEKMTLAIQLTDAELLFQSEIKAGGIQRFFVSHAPAKEVPHPSLVSGLFVLPRQDYAWENDRIAFRVYGPALAAEVNNGIDVWTKRVRYPIVGKWYKEADGSAPGKDSYHQDRGEGADFFSVGRTLGAGGSGLWRAGKVAQPGVFTSWKTLANGPIRVSFLLTYTWLLDGDSLKEEKVVSLDAGENLNRIEMRFSGAAKQEGMQIACGLVKRAGTTATQDRKRCVLSLWGAVNDNPVNGVLGTAVVVPRAEYLDLTEDKDQYLMIGESRPGTPFVYYAGAGWTGNGGFSAGKDWSGYLDRFVERMATPLQIRTHRGK
jgi:pectinesterase